jgi:hypothetical protein
MARSAPTRVTGLPHWADASPGHATASLPGRHCPSAERVVRSIDAVTFRADFGYRAPAHRGARATRPPVPAVTHTTTAFGGESRTNQRWARSISCSNMPMRLCAPPPKGIHAYRCDLSSRPPRDEPRGIEPAGDADQRARRDRRRSARRHYPAPGQSAARGRGGQLADRPALFEQALVHGPRQRNRSQGGDRSRMTPLTLPTALDTLPPHHCLLRASTFWIRVAGEGANAATTRPSPPTRWFSPSPARRRTGSRSPGSRRSSFPSSDPWPPTSTGTGSRPHRRRARGRSAGRAGR